MPVEYPRRNVLADIESAIRERLIRGRLPGKAFALADAAAPESIQCPAVNISYDGTPTFRRVSNDAWQMDCAIIVTIIVRNEGGEEKRRGDIYPLIIGAVALLATRDRLTRRIDGVDTPVAASALVPGPIKKVFDEGALLAVALSFSTTVTLPLFDTADEAADLVAASLGIMLKPGDDTADVGAVVDLTGEGD